MLTDESHPSASSHWRTAPVAVGHAPRLMNKGLMTKSLMMKA